jgi:glycosyltransferase involved in cell wall biosynthesis
MSKTYRIAIDGNEANIAQRVGSNAYAYELLMALEKITANREDIVISILLTDVPLTDLPAERTGWQYVVFGPKALWTQLALPLHLFTHQKEYDVFYTPGHYGPRVSVIPYVSSVMDLAFLYFPKQFKTKDFLQLKEWTRYSVKGAQKIIAISEHTKKDVVEQYHIPLGRVAVAYPGISLANKPSLREKDRVEVFKKLKLKHPFILYVGTLQPRKNLLRLIEAFEALYSQRDADKKKNKTSAHRFAEYKLEDLQLVIAGKVGWLAESILDKIHHSPVKDRIILTGYITEKEKIILFQESLCTVLVGLYEGFGIPALEAMAYGSVPIVSSTTSLPEVVGQGGIQVNPLKVKEISTAIQSVLEMPAKERARLLKKGRQQVKKFNWESSAEVVLQTVLSIVE